MCYWQVHTRINKKEKVQRKHFFSVWINVSLIDIYVYISTHIGWNKTNTFKLLLVSCFHIHQAYTITLTRYTHYIITTKFKLLSHFLAPMSVVLIKIAVNQYDATLHIIIRRFQEEFISIATFGNKFYTFVQKTLLICPRNYVLYCYAQIIASLGTINYIKSSILILWNWVFVVWRTSPP